MHQQQRIEPAVLKPNTYRRDNMARVNEDTDRLIGNVEGLLHKRRMKRAVNGR